MALLDSECFALSTTLSDYTTYGAFAASGSTVGLSVGTSGPLSDNYLSVGSAGNGVTFKRILSSTPGTFFWGGRVAFVQNATLGWNIYFYDSNGTTEQFHVSFSLSGVITTARAGTTLGTSAAGSIPITALGVTLVWSYLEIGGVIGTGTSGSVTIRVNGSVVSGCSVSSTNTQNGTTATIGAWALGVGTSVFVPALTHHYLCDNSGSSPWNTYLGDVRVQACNPTSNNSVQFTPNGLANNYQNCALVPPVPGTDYNSSTTLNNMDTFNVAAADSSFTTVYGVHVKVLAQKAGTGARSLETYLGSGANMALGTSTALSTSAIQLRTMSQTDPNTGAAWTLANANASKPGYVISL